MANATEPTETTSPWERTLTEMRALAAERRAEGWTAATVQAGDTTPEPPSAGESDRFGIVYTVPNDSVDPIRSFSDDGSVDEYTVYRRTAGSTLFVVTELADHDSRAVLFVAGAVDLDYADDLKTAAAAAGEMYTHLQLLDWTHLASFRHDDPSAFFESLE